MDSPKERRKTVKRILIVLLLLMFLLPTAFADECYVLCKPSAYVNARISPSAKSEAIGRFDCGDSIETDWVTKKDKNGNRWVHVIGTLESDAWISESFIQDSPVIIENAKATVVANGRTAVRDKPNGKRNKWVNNGSDITIFAYSNEWAITKNGYISMECIEVWHE